MWHIYNLGTWLSSHLKPANQGRNSVVLQTKGPAIEIRNARGVRFPKNMAILFFAFMVFSLVRTGPAPSASVPRSREVRSFANQLPVLLPHFLLGEMDDFQTALMYDTGNPTGCIVRLREESFRRALDESKVVVLADPVSGTEPFRRRGRFKACSGAFFTSSAGYFWEAWDQRTLVIYPLGVGGLILCSPTDLAYDIVTTKELLAQRTTRDTGITPLLNVCNAPSNAFLFSQRCSSNKLSGFFAKPRIVSHPDRVEISFLPRTFGVDDSTEASLKNNLSTLSSSFDNLPAPVRRAVKPVYAAQVYSRGAIIDESQRILFWDLLSDTTLFVEDTFGFTWLLALDP